MNLFSLQDLSLLENMQLGLETIVGAIFEESVLLSNPQEVKFGLRNILEGCPVSSLLLM